MREAEGVRAVAFRGLGMCGAAGLIRWDPQTHTYIHTLAALLNLLLLLLTRVRIFHEHSQLHRHSLRSCLAVRGWTGQQQAQGQGGGGARANSSSCQEEGQAARAGGQGGRREEGGGGEEEAGEGGREGGHLPSQPSPACLPVCCSGLIFREAWRLLSCCRSRRCRPCCWHQEAAVW